MAPRPFESRIQDLVYNVDVGIGLRLIKGGLYILFVFLVLLLYTATQFKGLKEAEAMDYAQLGRNLMQQKQLVTQTVRPATMWHLIKKSKQENPRIERHPDIIHPPLYPAALAAWFKITGTKFGGELKGGVYAPEYLVVTLGHIFVVLSGVLVFLLALRLFERRVALLGVSLFFLSNTIWKDAISGLNLSMTMFLGLAAFYAATLAIDSYKQGKKPVAWLIPFAVSTVCVAAAFLTRYSAIVLLPALLLVYGVAFGRRWYWPVAALVLFLVLIAPWIMRNVAVSGTPFGFAPYLALNDTSLYEEDMLERSLAPTFKADSVRKALNQKWLSTMARFYNDGLVSVGDGLLAGIFLCTFFYRFARPSVGLLRWGLALGLVALLLGGSVFGDDTLRTVNIFWPFMILYACAFFYLLVDRMQIRTKIVQNLVISALVLTTSFPLIFSLLPPRASVPYPPYFPPYIFHVTGMLDRSELICTDMPWATAWYGDRNSLYLPASIDEFYEINDYTKNVSGLYFTTLTRDRPFIRNLVTGSHRTWFPVLQGQLPNDWPLSQGFGLGAHNLDQLFLTDRPRWQSP